MNAQIISIGTELVTGQTVDTNAAWLAQQLAALGVSCTRHVTVADEREAVVRTIAQAAGDADLVLVTGGLGPTPDDLTRDALADALGVELVLHPGCLSQIEEYFRARRRPMHDGNRRQAMLPRGADPIENTCGTAPGLRAKLARADIYVMPGVPAEMRAMFERSIRPRLPQAAGGAIILQHAIHTFGMSESEAGEKLADLMQRGRNPTVGTSAHDLIITVRINALGRTPAEARRLLDADATTVRDRLGRAVFGEADQSLSHAVAALLVEGRKTIATAESCTGGLIAKRLTDVPGSSTYFVQSLVTYSNQAKHRLLQIPPDLIERHGAVSAEVARAMAENCRRLAGTDFALSATGIAGPTGGSHEKPVGLVFVALADARGVTVRELRLGDTLSRDQVRDRTAKAALNMLRLALLPQK